MALMFSPKSYQHLQKRWGEEETRDIVPALGEASESSNKKTGEALQRIENKADFLITRKKFELKNELTKRLATKTDAVRLEGEIQNMKVMLDRKMTIMFIILLFSNIFHNQNALRNRAELPGLICP